MGEEENKKLFAHYTGLVGGSVTTGNSTRDALIVSDATRHLADLIKKNPSLAVPVVEPTPEPVEETPKKKGKK